MQDHEIDGMQGCDIIDPAGDKVGTFVSMVSDRDTLTPDWAVVQYGLTHHRTLVPMSKVYRTEDGKLATMIDKGAIHQAPKMHGCLLYTSPSPRDS